jgi:hypothetical protein
MKELEKVIEGRGSVKGKSMKQLKSSNYAYLYECTGEDFNTHYEVFRRVENKRFNCVSYPGDEAFGKWAWTFTKKCEAAYIYDILNMEGENV